MDTRGVVQDIEIFSGSLGGGEKEEISLVSSLDSLDSSADYIVQLIVVSDIYGATSLVSEVLKFDLEF
jgi:hypothetical protein